MGPIPRAKIPLSTKVLLRFILNIGLWISPRKAKNLIEDFETTFSVRYGYPRGIATCRARTGFFLILEALPLKKGGEVIISGLQIADFINMIRLAGFIPVVVDLKKDALTMDIGDLEQKITKNTQLVLVTHLSGYTTDMEEILRITKPRGIFVIEDCSQAVSSTLRGRMLGTLGDAAIFSLSLLKPISTIYGGFILSKDNGLINSIRDEIESWPTPSRTILLFGALKHLIMMLATSSVFFALITHPALSARTAMIDLFANFQKQNPTAQLRKAMPKIFLQKFCWQQAALGISQLPTLKNQDETKATAGYKLYFRINTTPHISLPKMDISTGNSFWLFPIFAPNPEKLQRHLLSRGVDSSRLLLSCLSEELAFSDLNLTSPNAESHKRNILFLPIYPYISDIEIDRIVNAVNEYL
jgi:dTDP-4-amino-4,6-dideoxygalactose transaminase